MQETKKLRRQLAISRLEQAVSMGTRHRIDLAARLAGEAIQLDPEVPQAHAVLAKLRFWSGDMEGAAEELLKYCMAGGKVLKGLQKRRIDERALFLS